MLQIISYTLKLHLKRSGAVKLRSVIELRLFLYLNLSWKIIGFIKTLDTIYNMPVNY